MTTEPTARTSPDDALIYLPLPHPLGMTAVYGEREGMVSAADLPPTPDLNDARAYYAWTAEVARVFAERGVLDASRRDQEAALLVSRCPHWCPGRHAMADVELGGIDHSRVLLDLDDGGRVDVSAYQSRDGSIEEPTITLSMARDDVDPDGAERIAAALIQASTLVRALRAASTS